MRLYHDECLGIHDNVGESSRPLQYRISSIQRNHALFKLATIPRPSNLVFLKRFGLVSLSQDHSPCIFNSFIVVFFSFSHRLSFFFTTTTKFILRLCHFSILERFWPQLTPGGALIYFCIQAHSRQTSGRRCVALGPRQTFPKATINGENPSNKLAACYGLFNRPVAANFLL